MQDSETRDAALTSALRAVAADEAARGVSSAVEARLLTEVRSIGRARQRRRYATLAVAAALLAAVAVPVWRMSGRRPGPGASTTGARTGATQSTTEVATAFFALPYSSVPARDAQLLRMQVPRAALASFGLAPLGSVDDPGSATVLADVVVGEDGLARAVRFVRAVN